MMERPHVYAFLLAVGSAACNGDVAGEPPLPLADDESDEVGAAFDLTDDSEPQHAEPGCHNAAACCPAGTVAVFGTALNDNMTTGAAAICQLAMGGADNVANTSESGLHAVLAGPGNDNVQGGWGKGILAGGTDADTIRGRGSADELYGQAGNDTLDGGPGNDRVSGGTENDTLIGGPGGDSVDGGAGNDHVYVYDLCELASGELLNGGAGVDTLHSPIPASQLGVPVSNFESYVVEASPEKSMCTDCGCEYVAGEGIVCCNGRGTCDVADEEGNMVCDCDPGYAGRDCGYDPEETDFDDPPPACEEPGVMCGSTYPVNDAILEHLDLTSTGACDDLDMLALQPMVDLLVIHPADEDGEWMDGEFPFVLFNAGNTYDETWYRPLAEDLAARGFVVVASSPSPLPPGTKNYGLISIRGEGLHCLRRILPDLALVAGDPPLGDHHNGTLAYMGHSRGGEAAVVATSLDAEEGIPEPSAVIALAPTSFCSENAPPSDCGYDDVGVAHSRGWLDDGQTRGFLVMHGSKDGDPTGRGVTLFDVAAKEHADDVAGGFVEPPADAMVKAMKWIETIPHGQWIGGDTAGGLLAQTFGRAFLEWHLLGDTSGRGLFTGTDTDPCVADPSSCELTFPAPIISSQYRESGSAMGGRRGVVRYFSELLTSSEGIGGTATKSGAVSRVVATESGPRAWVRGFAAQMEASNQKTAWLELGLARRIGASTFPTDAVAEGFSHLSFRLVRTIPDNVIATLTEPQCVAAAAANTTPLSVRVTLEDAGAVKATVHSSALTTVRPAHVVWTTKSDGSSFCEAVSSWTTIRIPLSDFAGVNLRALSKVRFTLDTSDHGGQPIEALLDSVELVGHELDGICGDDIINGEEECDGTDLGGAACEPGQLGSVECTSACTLTNGCFDCVAGDVACTCLDENVDGMHPSGPLPGNGSLGDGHYCSDDVVFGGTTRCVQDGNVFTCEQCTVGDGEPFCPCVPGNGCLNGSECHFACEALPCTEETMALQYGYCFYPGEDPEDGGVPPWFYDSYCSLYWDDFVCRNDGDPEGGNLCVEEGAGGGVCVL